MWDTKLQGAADISLFLDPIYTITYAHTLHGSLDIYRVFFRLTGVLVIKLLVVISASRSRRARTQSYNNSSTTIPQFLPFPSPTYPTRKSSHKWRWQMHKQRHHLKGDKESARTIQAALCTHRAPGNVYAGRRDAHRCDRASSLQDRYIDLVVPRGSNTLVREILKTTRTAAMGHADWLCGIYLDESTDREMAKRIVVDANSEVCRRVALSL